MLYLRIAEGVFFKLFAGHAPVGVEIEHDRFAFRLRQGAVKVIHVLNLYKIQMSLRLTCRGAKRPVLEWTDAHQRGRQQKDL